MNKQTSRNRPVNGRAWWVPARPAAVASGAVGALLGAMVLAGWYTESPTLTRIDPAWAPMEFNAAIGFVLLGGALVILAGGRLRWARGLGGFAALLAAATLAEYVLGRDLGIDRLLFQQPATAMVQATHPGRMPANTTLCFLIAGLGIALASWRGRSRALILATAGSMLGALALTSLSGYLLHIEAASGWGQLGRMAAHSAVGFLVLGCGLMALAWGDRDRSDADGPGWLPIPIGAAVGTLLLCASQAAADVERAQLKTSTHAAAEGIRAHLELEVGDALAPLARMALRWEEQGGIPREQWSRDAEALVRDGHGLRAIEWVDPTDHVRWIAPLAGNEAARDLHLAADPVRRAALDRARRTAKLSASRTVNLVQGGQGVLVYAPLRVDGRGGGFLLAVLDLSALFDAVLTDEVEAHYHLVVRDGDEVIYATRAPDASAPPSVGQPAAFEGAVRYAGHAWHVAVWPSAALAGAHRSSVPPLLAWGGLFMALLLGWAAHLRRRTRQQARALSLAHADLELRVLARTAELERANRELARSNAELDAFAYVASHDLRAPMRDVDNLSQWIAEDVGDALPEESRRHFDTLRGRVRRMEALLDGLLEYSRAGRVSGTPEPVDVRAVLDDVLSLSAPPPGFQVLLSSAPPTVQVPRAALEQVLRNLIGNAIKHHDRAAGTVVVEVVSHGDLVEFSVTDDGPGIPLDLQARAFAIFQKVHARDGVEGAGMGLALVKRVVEAYGGTVGLESATGAGARFHFTWPAFQAP